MKIRIANLNDLHAMTDIYNQAILTKRSTADLETFTFEERKPWFASHQNKDYPLYVIEKDEQVIGYVYLSGYRPGRRAMKDTVEVSYYIHLGHIRQGIGSKLLDFILDKARELNYKTVVAILLEVNIGSIKLLEKFKFEEWGRIKDVADLDDVVCSHLYLGLKI